MQTEVDEKKMLLLDILKPGDTVYTILRRVSKSGMSRSISLIKVENDGTPRQLDHLVAKILDMKCDQNNSGIKIGGCGMDMGFQLVYSLSRKLFQGDFECIGEKCPSNDHNNGDRNYSPDHQHSDGGYALRHWWL